MYVWKHVCWSLPSRHWEWFVQGCMYVHMYVCMYICMYVCMYACTYVCMYVMFESFMQSCMHAYIHTHTHTRSHNWFGSYTYRHTDTQTHRHTDTQTHRHTDTQTHRHTDTHRNDSALHCIIKSQDTLCTYIQIKLQTHMATHLSLWFYYSPVSLVRGTGLVRCACLTQ
jgi:hypothetical protein